ncbi:hypothetical protein [Lentzea sp. NPDC055074]
MDASAVKDGGRVRELFVHPVKGLSAHHATSNLELRCTQHRGMTVVGSFTAAGEDAFVRIRLEPTPRSGLR